MSVEASDKGKFTGRHMAIIMIAFFAVIIVVNLTMAMLANRSWSGLVVKNTYVESQKFNARLGLSRLQASLGWKGELLWLNNGISYNLINDKGRGVELDRLEIVFRRPTTEAQDQVVLLQEKKAGTYFGDVSLAAGAWTAEVLGYLSGQSKWKMNYRILVRLDGTFTSVVNNTGATK